MKRQDGHVINIATGKVEQHRLCGSGTRGGGYDAGRKRFYVTCEAGGDVYVIDAAGYTTVGHFK